MCKPDVNSKVAQIRARGKRCFMKLLVVKKSIIKSTVNGTATAKDEDTKYLNRADSMVLWKGLLSS